MITAISARLPPSGEMPTPNTCKPMQEEVESVHRYSLSELMAGKDAAGNTLKSTPDGIIALEKYSAWLVKQEQEA